MKLETIYKYIQEQATTLEIEEVESWLHESEENKNQFNLIRQSLQIADTWKPTPNTDAAWTKITDRIGEENPKVGWIRPLLSAAAIILIIAGFFLIRNITGGENYYAQIGQSETIQLVDQSTVHLNAGTKLKFKSSKTNRAAHLNGEALFDVSHNPNKPFSVLVNEVEILVIGTVFSVEAYPESNNIKVRVLEGSIVCKLSGQEDQKLTAGEMIFYSKSVKQMTKSEIKNEGFTGSWQSGQLAFDEELFEDVIIRLENWFGVDIKNNTGLEEKFTSSFRRNVTLDEVLEILEANFRLKIEKSERLIILSI